MNKLAIFVAVSTLAACPLQKSSSTTLGGLRSGGDSSSSGPGASGDPNAMITMPNLIGKTQEEAASAVKAAGFKMEMDATHLSCVESPAPVGTVECQDPRPGDVVKANYTAVEIHIKRDSRMSGIIHQEDFRAMRGMTVDNAKAFAKKLGHTGQIRVKEMDDLVKGCAEKTVCSATDEYEGQSGMRMEDTLLLRTNKTVSTTPTPD